MNISTRICWLSIMVFVATTIAQADETSARREQIKKWKEIYLSEAGAHEMKVGLGGKRKLSLHKKPLLSYTNPASGRDSHGQFFAWMDEGRPAVIGTIWSKLNKAGGDTRRIIHSLHTLTSEPLHDVLRGEDFWFPKKQQVISTLLEGASKPAKSEGLRLAQMRKLAREFKAVEMKKRETGDKVPHALRLQAEPILRFKSPSKGIEDGALFAFFVDWDPDLVLRLESKQTKQGRRWHYSTVPFTSRQIEVSHKGKKWQHDISGATSLTGAYKSVHGVAYRPAVLQ